MPLRIGSTARATHAPSGVLRVFVTLALALFALPSVPAAVHAQAGAPLDSLLLAAEAASPALRAAYARVLAARARVDPAGTRPDPMLMLGVVNLPLSRPNFTDDEMTMRMIGVGQRLPYPGTLRLRRRAATYEAEASDAALASARLDVARTVRESYYELAYLDRAVALLHGTEQALSEIVRVAAARYGTGVGEQQDVLTARVEATRVTESASALLEQRHAVLAQLNGALDRPSDTPVKRPRIPAHLERVAVAADPMQVRFAAATLGARATGSPLPSLDVLQGMALAGSPRLREQAALIAAQSARVALARWASRPDVDLSLQYGQRQGRPDMITAQIALPLPLQRAKRQDAQQAESAAELTALEAEQQAQRNAIRAEVARLDAEIARSRTQLALYTKAVLPQAQAALAASLASYRTGRTALTAVLDARSAVFAYEMTYARAMADFAKGIAALEQVTGSSLLAERAP